MFPFACGVDARALPLGNNGATAGLRGCAMLPFDADMLVDLDRFNADARPSERRGFVSTRKGGGGGGAEAEAED